MQLIPPDRHPQWFILALGLAIAVGFASLSVLPTPTSAQNTTSVPAATAPELHCVSAPVRKNPPPLPSDPLKGQIDPFVGQLDGPSLPAGLLPVNAATRDSILGVGLPCQESASPNGQEPIGLENLQRGFDFYSWRTFIALNSPADGTSIEQAKPDTPTVWERMDSFKQLLDVMLPPGQEAASWPTDRLGMEAERKRLMPPACKAVIDAHKEDKEMSGRMVVKMIEESFNEPFKTGPLIDQDGRYAIFDILMNGRMFDYIKNNHLNTITGQINNSSLVVDFPVGLNSTPKTPNSDIGAFMLKVSWKILSDKEIHDQTFHTVNALVLTPPNPKGRKCLPETLGLIGFHAVHKTASRPQWIWTSFEHVKNVPDKDEVALGKFNGSYNFYNKNCKGCTVNATPPTPWTPDPALDLKFRHDDSFKSQIVRETGQTNAAKNMNAIFQSMLANTVWKNYMLISTQWPSNFPCTQAHLKGTPNPNPDFTKPGTDFTKQPDMTCSPAPTFMANSTLETYSQGDTPLASSSCIACHGNAASYQRGASDLKSGKLNQSDFTFILEKAQ
jgi:hypothetical protein